MLLPALMGFSVQGKSLQDSSSSSSLKDLSEELLENELDRESLADCLESCNILQYVDKQEFESKNHLYRLPELESLSSYAFRNTDGTTTIYYLDQQVKFINGDGEVAEKDISLIEKSNGYGIVKSDIGLTLPNKITDGITLDYSGYSIKLIPNTRDAASNKNLSDMSLSDKVTKKVTKIENSIVYSKLFGENTDVRYTPLLSGIKEDIILASYTPDARYSFTLQTDGLYLCESEGKYYLAKTLDSAPIFHLGDVIVYDSMGKPSKGRLSVLSVSTASEYNIIVEVDDEFLSDPETVYPVTIDPSITVSDSTHGIGAIEDSPVFSGYATRNFGSFLYNRMGTPSSTYGIGRTVVKLSGLTSSDEYKSISGVQITDVKFYAKESSGGSSQFINLYPLTENTTWTESTVTWNNVGAFDTSVNYGATMFNNQWTAFDITNLVKSWKNQIYSASAGFIMTNENETGNSKSFDSSECTNADNRPYVVMTYDSSIGVDYENATVMSLYSSYPVMISDQGANKCFKFTPSATGFYTFESSSNVGDPEAILYDSQKNFLKSDLDSAGSSNFRVAYHLLANQTYYLIAFCSKTPIGSYNVSVSPTSSASHITTSTLYFGRQRFTSNSVSGVTVYKFTPEISGEYLIYSTGDVDSRAWLYNSALQKISEDDDGGGDHNNFRLNYNLEAGADYYIVAGCYGDDSGYYYVTSLKRINIPEGDYHLRNLKTTHYLDVQGPQAQEYVQQWSYKRSSSEKWTFSEIMTGHYSIQSAYGDKKYVGISDASVSTDNVKLYPSCSTCASWRIYTNQNAELFFEPMNALGKFMCVPNSSQGTELQLECMGTSVNNRNKWKLECRSETPVEGQRWSQWCWATTARMFANHYVTVPDERDQVQAVLAVKGEIVNEKGTFSEVVKAINYYVSGNTSVNELNVIGLDSGTLEQNVLNQLIDNGHVMVYRRLHKGPGGMSFTNHALILLGYTTVYENGTIQRRYISYNPMPTDQPKPWDDYVEAIDGVECVQTYEDFLKIKVEKLPDTEKWVGYAIVQS